KGADSTAAAATAAAQVVQLRTLPLRREFSQLMSKQKLRTRETLMRALRVQRQKVGSKGGSAGTLTQPLSQKDRGLLRMMAQEKAPTLKRLLAQLMRKGVANDVVEQRVINKMASTGSKATAASGGTGTVRRRVLGETDVDMDGASTALPAGLAAMPAGQ